MYEERISNRYARPGRKEGAVGDAEFPPFVREKITPGKNRGERGLFLIRPRLSSRRASGTPLALSWAEANGGDDAEENTAGP
jgi:hypothetical protein